MTEQQDDLLKRVEADLGENVKRAIKDVADIYIYFNSTMDSEHDDVAAAILTLATLWWSQV